MSRKSSVFLRSPQKFVPERKEERWTSPLSPYQYSDSYFFSEIFSTFFRPIEPYSDDIEGVLALHYIFGIIKSFELYDIR